MPFEVDNARVLGVGTATGALEALERSHFDVVFLDLWLQNESGLNVLPEILRLQAGIGVIVITAFATFETAVEAMRLGAVDYLPKPFTPEQIRHAARRVVAANALRYQISELQDRLDETEGDATFETLNQASCRISSDLCASRGFRIRCQVLAARRKWHRQIRDGALDPPAQQTR